MFIGEFVKKLDTTKDTVRFYIEKGLLKPVRKGRNYWYGTREEEDFQQIRDLQQIGFSIAMIQEIRNRHDNDCGTSQQWEANRRLVTSEIEKVEDEIALLQERREQLINLASQLDVRMK